MKNEKNVQAKKTRGEMPIGEAIGETGNSLYAKKHGKLTPYEYLTSPTGSNEKETTDSDGS